MCKHIAVFFSQIVKNLQIWLLWIWAIKYYYDTTVIMSCIDNSDDVITHHPLIINKIYILHTIWPPIFYCSICITFIIYNNVCGLLFVDVVGHLHPNKLVAKYWSLYKMWNDTKQPRKTKIEPSWFRMVPINSGENLVFNYQKH